MRSFSLPLRRFGEMNSQMLSSNWSYVNGSKAAVQIVAPNGRKSSRISSSKAESAKVKVISCALGSALALQVSTSCWNLVMDHGTLPLRLPVMASAEVDPPSISDPNLPPPTPTSPPSISPEITPTTSPEEVPSSSPTPEIEFPVENDPPPSIDIPSISPTEIPPNSIPGESPVPNIPLEVPSISPPTEAPPLSTPPEISFQTNVSLVSANGGESSTPPSRAPPIMPPNTPPIMPPGNPPPFPPPFTVPIPPQGVPEPLPPPQAAPIQPDAPTAPVPMPSSTVPGSPDLPTAMDQHDQDLSLGLLFTGCSRTVYL